MDFNHSDRDAYVEYLEKVLMDTIIERNYAQTLFCDFIADDRRQGYVDHPNATPSAVAKEYGWDHLVDSMEAYEREDADLNNEEFRTTDMS